MFCPKCAEQNLDDAKFCRACGANVSLVPQALTGELPAGEAENKISERRAAGIKCTIISLGLAVVAVTVLLVAPPHDGWVFFFLAGVAAVIMFGIAVGEFVAVAGHGKHHAHGFDKKTAELAPPDVAGELPPARETASMIQPASVAESTTRNLAPLETHKTKARSRNEGDE